MNAKAYFTLVNEMARMGLRADASRYLLGYLWWVIEPLIYVAVFYLVFAVILETGRSDFLPFLICGKFAFVWFSKTVNQSSNSIISNKGLISNIDIPKSMFPLVVVQQSTIKQTAVFALLFLILPLMGYPPTFYWLWIIPLFVANYLLIVMFAFISALLVCWLSDFKMIISQGMIFLLFVSGIFWDVRDIPDPALQNLVLTVNPIAFLLDGYRQVLMYQNSPDWLHLSVIGIIAAIFIAVLLKLIRRISHIIALKAITS